jgi:MFS-type transporter involved in bile tolerance (Atg22 family)
MVVEAAPLRTRGTMAEQAIARREWASGWTLVLASSLGFSFFSVMLATTGLFMEPVSKAFGWSRTLYSSGVTIATLTTALASPFLGIIIDKWGARRRACC